MLIVISKVMANRNRVSKYTLIEPKSRKIVTMLPIEVRKMLEANQAIGFCKQGNNAVRPSNYFKHITRIGEENKKGYTVILKRVSEEGIHFDISDGLGNVETISKDELLSLLVDGERINGVMLRNGSLMVCKAIETIIDK